MLLSKQTMIRVTVREVNERERRLNGTVALFAFPLAVTLLIIEKNYPVAYLSLLATLLVEIHAIGAAAGPLSDFRVNQLPPDQRRFWKELRGSYFSFRAGLRRYWLFTVMWLILGAAALPHSF